MNTRALQAPPRWREYLEITKPKVVALLTFTATVGMLLAARTVPPWTVLVFGSAGIALVSGAAAAINQVVDRRIDAVMARTRNRPLPRGVLETRQVLAFAALLAAAGMWLLLTFTNVLCAILTFASLLGYAVIYTMFLKRATPQNIVIGGAAGAAPPLLGWIRRDRPVRSRGGSAVRDRLRMDAAAFLGAGHPSPRGTKPGSICPCCRLPTAWN